LYGVSVIGRRSVVGVIEKVDDAGIAGIEVAGERLFVGQHHGLIDRRSIPGHPYRILGSHHSLPKSERLQLEKLVDRRSGEKASQYGGRAVMLVARMDLRKKEVIEMSAWKLDVSSLLALTVHWLRS
jgi:hypothetical protein